ncbi:MAG TPA: hypothetical protein VF017_22975 [Thermoanaerobaculia bacterium]|nr:hypothetical protein [Thermoanaerobaculia bacterium]
MRRFGERGDSNLGCVLWLIALLIAGMVLWKAVPVKIANSELYDYMLELTRFSSGRSPEEIKKRVHKKAQELKLPLDAKNITVEKNRERIRIRCKYTVPLEFPGYTYLWEVEHDIDRQIFYL